MDKDRSQQAIAIEIKSATLGRTISNGLGVYFGAASPRPPDVNTLLNNYGALKRHLETLDSLLPGYPETLEFRLLVEDFLLDGAVFEGLELELPGPPHVISQEQLRDIHARSIDTGLDILDDSFRLGIMPFDVTDDTLRALSTRYTQTALHAGIAAPGDLGPPIIPSGSHAPRHDPVFLRDAEPEQPASYQSFSNLALRIKSAPQGSDVNSLLLPNAEDSANRCFKAGSPLRPDTTKGYADSSLGLDSDVFTSLSALENEDGPVGLGDWAVARGTTPFHKGVGFAGPAVSTELSGGFGEYFTSRSEGIPETDFEPLFLGSRDAVLPAASLPTTTATGILGISGDLFGGTLTEGKSVHLLRQKLGRDLVASLTSHCRTVRDAIGNAEPGSLESSISAHFTSFIRVWSEGVGVFRRVTSNHPPRGLLEVLDCLVVASAMCATVGSCSGRESGTMYFE